MKPFIATNIKVKRKVEKAGLRLQETPEYRMFLDALIETLIKKSLTDL